MLIFIAICYCAWISIKTLGDTFSNDPIERKAAWDKIGTGIKEINYNKEHPTESSKRAEII